MPRAAPTPVETFSYLRRAPSEPPTTQEWAVAASAQLVDAVDPRPRGSTAAVRSTIEYLAAYAVAVGSAAPSPWLPAEQRRLALVSELTGWHVRVVERRAGVRQLVTSLARRRSVLGALVHHPQRPWLGPVRREGDAILADITLDLEQRNAELWLRLVGWCRDLRRAVAGAGTPAMRGDGRRAIPDLDRGVEGDDVGRDVEDDDVGVDADPDADPDAEPDGDRGGRGHAPEVGPGTGVLAAAREQRVIDVVREIAETALQMAAEDLPDELTGVRLRWVLDGDVARLRADPSRPKEFKRAGVVAALRRIVIECESGALLARMAASHVLAARRTKPWVERLLRPLVEAELARVDGMATPHPKQVSRMANSTYAILGQVIELRLRDTADEEARRVLEYWAAALDRALRRVERPGGAHR